MRLLYGLGNPGNKYRGNRHNVGSRLVRSLARENEVHFDQTLNHSVCGRCTLPSTTEKVVLSVPTTFINASGKGYEELREEFSLSFDETLVIHDDMDLDPGTIRIRPSGGAGGHNGMKSILEHSESREIPRMRIGIGRPPNLMDASDYVLQDFLREEMDEIRKALKDGKQAVTTWINDGIVTAMNTYNG